MKKNNNDKLEQRKAAERMFDASVNYYKMLLDIAERGVKIKDVSMVDLFKNTDMVILSDEEIEKIRKQVLSDFNIKYYCEK